MACSIETIGDDTIVRFPDLECFLEFHGAMIYKLGEDLYFDIRTQFIERDSPYAFKFKTEDYKKFVE